MTKTTLSTSAIKFLFFTLSVLLITACSTKEESHTTTTTTIHTTKTSFHLSLNDANGKKITNKTVVLSRLISIDKNGAIDAQGEISKKMNDEGIAIFNLEELNFYFPGEKYVAIIDNNTSKCLNAPSPNQQVKTNLIYKLLLATKENCK